MKRVILFTLSCLVSCLLVSAQKIGLSIHYNMVMQIPKEVYSMSDLSKRQMIINQLSNQHKLILYLLMATNVHFQPQA